MKKIVFIIILLPLWFYSQEKGSAFSLLLTAGVAPAQIHGDAYSGYNKVGPLVGFGTETDFSESGSASLSFLYIQKGARKNQNPTKGDLNYYYVKLNYLEVPLVFTYTQKKYLLDIGVSAAYLINYYEADQNTVNTGTYPFLKYDYSVKVGLGYHINSKWTVNFRSSNSFMTIRPNRTKQAIYFNNILARTFNKGYYNNILEFTLTYKIKPKKKSAS